MMIFITGIITIVVLAICLIIIGVLGSIIIEMYEHEFCIRRAPNRDKSWKSHKLGIQKLLQSYIKFNNAGDTIEILGELLRIGVFTAVGIAAVVVVILLVGAFVSLLVSI